MFKPKYSMSWKESLIEDLEQWSRNLKNDIWKPKDAIQNMRFKIETWDKKHNTKKEGE